MNKRYLFNKWCWYNWVAIWKNKAYLSFIWVPEDTMEFLKNNIKVGKTYLSMLQNQSPEIMKYKVNILIL